MLTATVVATLALTAPAAAAVTKTSYMVPVSQPDESGQPVSIDTDVYVPDAPAPRAFVVVFHGGGSEKANEFDAGHARRLAENGYTTLIYSQRGHGDSGGQTTVAGPKEMRDAYDVIAWAIGKRAGPQHPDFGIDTARMGLLGDSQGGLHTNLVEAYSADSTLDPYGLDFKAIAPGNTPDLVFQALVPNGVSKLSLGVGLVETYLVGTKGKISPLLYKWIGTEGLDNPDAYGPPADCPGGEHDTLTSSMKADLAARSVGCLTDRVKAPAIWAQALDDTIFPPEMAVQELRQFPAGSANRLYLDMAGHGAPGYDKRVDDDRFGAQLEFLDHELRGRPLTLPPVVYWTRDPDVQLKGYRYPFEAWLRRTASSWPPPNVSATTFGLGADGKLAPAGAAAGSLPLSVPPADVASDPVLQTVFGGSAPGTSPGNLNGKGAPGLLAAFETEPFKSEQELSGTPLAKLAWTPASPDTQLVLKVLDKAPDGRLTLLTRGVQGIRGAAAGQERTVGVKASDLSEQVHPGHSLVAWVSAGDATFYKAYPGSAGGALAAGTRSTLELPLGEPAGPAAGRGARPRLKLTVKPRRARAGRRTRFTFRVTSSRKPVKGAVVRFAGRRARTNRRGRARIRRRIARPGRFTARATRRGMTSAKRRIRILRRR